MIVTLCRRLGSASSAACCSSPGSFYRLIGSDLRSCVTLIGEILFVGGQQVVLRFRFATDQHILGVRRFYSIANGVSFHWSRNTLTGQIQDVLVIPTISIQQYLNWQIPHLVSIGFFLGMLIRGDACALRPLD